MSLVAELEEFVTDHRPHGQLVGDGREPLPNSYEVTITCPLRCHVHSLGNTRGDAAVDLAASGASQLT